VLGRLLDTFFWALTISRSRHLGSVTTLHDVGGVLGQLLDTFLWALTISRSRQSARV
jgi:hypothetical protein